ncbi:MAG: GntR family transcriptional regulator [Xanthobacteraceae bacterium]|nr:GntR family transcriptional regulator [Xanthobacteraceae bacterium]
MKAARARPRRARAAPESEPRAESSADKVFRGVVRGLYDGRYVPGQRLVEADLMRDFAVGRGSVREALNRLAADGLVVLALHRGAQIRALSRAEALEIVDLLEVLIGLAARRAAERIDAPGQKALIRDALAALAGHARGAPFFAFVQARNAFWRALLRVAGSRELARVLGGVQVNLIRVQSRAAGPERARRADYRAVAAAVLAGDPRRAETAARRHVRQVRDQLGRLPEEA